MAKKALNLKAAIALLILLTISTFFTLLPTGLESSFYSVHQQSMSNNYHWWENWSRDKNHNKIDDLIEQKFIGNLLPASFSNNPENFSISVFIHYDHHPDLRDIQILQNMNVCVSYVAKYINVVCVRNINPLFVYNITELPGVVMVELQQVIYPRLNVSVRAIKARESVVYSPETAWELGYTGKDVVVAVLDTGVDDEHEFLRGKFVAGFDCSGPTASSDRETNPDDVDGHGTHVASIIMSSGGSLGIYKGVAPDAKLVDVKVLSEREVNLEDQLIRGIEWVITNKEKYNIKIINLSVGSDVEDPYGTSAVSQIANMAVDSGIVVVAAAGNEGPTPQSLVAPSVADKVICVTALDDKNTVNRKDDVIAYYSSRGPRGDGAQKPDVCAPGTDIIGAQAAETGEATNGVVSMSGTSMAAPHVAGLAALILEANPKLSPLQVKQIIIDTAEDKGAEGWDPDYGWGEIDAYEAVLAAVSELNEPPNIISATANTTEVYRVIESFALEVAVVDDRTPTENLTALMFVEDSFGTISKVQMMYENETGRWIGVFTPNASAPLGDYSAYARFYDNEGGENESERFHFTVLNNPPSIISFKIEAEVMRGEILTASVKAFDYEGLANASICFRSDDYWLNFTKALTDTNCIFEIDTSSFHEGKWDVFVIVQDADGAKVSSNYITIVILPEAPVLMFSLIALGLASLTALIVSFFFLRTQ